MQVKLKVLTGSSAGKELALTGEQFVIGRGEDCQLRPKSDAVSRRHCCITMRDNRVEIEDLGSRNGTHVNGERVEGPTELTLGDHLRVGRLEFEVLIDLGKIGGAKRPKVRDIKDAAARAGQTDSRAGFGDVEDWLEEGNERDEARKLAEPETRQFQLEETDKVALDAAAKESTAETTEMMTTEETVDESPKKKKKKEYGKLPQRPTETSADSRSAAADTLKKFFNRR